MFASPRLDYRNAAMKRVVDFHQAHQDEVIHDGADGKIRHVGGDPQELWILIIEESSHQTLLAIGHHGMEEIAVHADFSDGGAITCHPINHQPLYVMLLDNVNNASIVCVNVQLLRTLEQNLDGSGGDLLFQVKPQSLSVADNLRRVLIQGDEQSPRFLSHRPFPQNLRAQHRLSYPRYPDDHCGGPVKNAAANESVDSLNPDN